MLQVQTGQNRRYWVYIPTNGRFSGAGNRNYARNFGRSGPWGCPTLHRAGHPCASPL